MRYEEEDYLPLSGIQHFRFCRRQWALIHIENLWRENERTTEGEILHERAHNEAMGETRGDVITARSVRVHSSVLGISGACDVVEFRRSPDGISLAGREGLYRPFPVEYKKGAPREDDVNEVQLCAQAMCLEEMLCCEIREGALYFWQTRRREAITLTEELRQTVKRCTEEMHEMSARGYTPKVRPTKSCNACSLKDVCLPKLMRSEDVRAYMTRHLEDGE